MTEFDTERSMLVEQHGQEISDLQDIMFAMEQNFSERESDARSEFQSMRDEIKNKVRLTQSYQKCFFGNTLILQILYTNMQPIKINPLICNALFLYCWKKLNIHYITSK